MSAISGSKVFSNSAHTFPQSEGGLVQVVRLEVLLGLVFLRILRG